MLRLLVQIFVVAIIVACSSMLATAHSLEEDAFETSVFERFVQRHHRSTDLPQCSQCEAFVNNLVKIVENATELAIFEKTLVPYCTATFQPNSTRLEICRMLVNYLTQTNGGLWDLKIAIRNHWEVARVVCAMGMMCRLPCCDTSKPFLPEQVHLSFNYSWQPNNKHSSSAFEALRVTWVTLNVTTSSIVQWWYDDLPSKLFQDVVLTRDMDPNRTTYWQGGWVGAIHSAVMSALLPNKTIQYRVGVQPMSSSSSSSIVWSTRNYTVNTPPSNAGLPGGRPLRVVALADMGVRHMSNDTVRDVAQLVERDEVDFIVHYGDISYADGNQQDWDKYFRKIEPFASRVPYMTVPGNHERPWNFAAYKHRLWMPEPAPIAVGNTTLQPPAWPHSLYYAFTVGPVSVVMLDTEGQFGELRMTEEQLVWMNATLAALNTKKQRLATPWLFVSQHRPLYCTHISPDCSERAAHMRGMVEGAFGRNAVDIDFAGHVHDYERMYPTLSNGHVTSKNYTHPTAPVYVVNGAAGQFWGNCDSTGDASWSAYHSAAVGFSRLWFSTAASSSSGRTELTLKQQFVQSETAAILDEFTIVKEAP